MKTTAFALALLLGGAAIAQTGTAPDSAGGMAYDGDGITAPFETESGTAAASAAPAGAAQVVQPGNANPERDARGIVVISAPAVVPPGFNGTPAAAMGGPLLDPTTGEPVAERDYPPCTASVTDNCLQTYERGRRAD